MFTATFKFGDQALIKKMINNYDKIDRASASMSANKISYSSYATILKNKGFSTFLFLKLKGEKSLAFDVDDYEKYFDHFWILLPHLAQKIKSDHRKKLRA